MLEVHLPDEIFSGLDIGSKQKEEFVLESVKEKIERERQQNLTALLAEGYKATYDEDLALTKEFQNADLENL